MLLSTCTTETMIHSGMQEGCMAGLLLRVGVHTNAALAVCPRRQPGHAGRWDTASLTSSRLSRPGRADGHRFAAAHGPMSPGGGP
ncbi:hypothetical protein CHT98_24820 (plasmid) [Azospirillum brasilense]|uniref:Uncharacterized protein n=1 Tax=Azospirillum brasilense TaxID=192 RepID=A0A235H7F0_AZOBR|nr:hypothetical protein CHT98_24820 [Azospirillum brasilense]